MCAHTFERECSMYNVLYNIFIYVCMYVFVSVYKLDNDVYTNIYTPFRRMEHMNTFCPFVCCQFPFHLVSTEKRKDLAKVVSFC